MKSFSPVSLLVLIVSFSFSTLHAQGAPAPTRMPDSTSTKTSTSLATPAIDSAAVRSQKLEANRKLASSLDDSIARYQRLRPICMLGIVAGAAITVVGLVNAQQKAQEEAQEKSMRSGKSETAIEFNIIGIVVGLPLMAISAYAYSNMGTKISGFEWQKSKLKLSMDDRGTNLAYAFQTSF
jgi:hypothetical protein